MSERRACRTIGCVRMMVRYRCRRPDDAELRERLRNLARARRRFGYRRLGLMLERQGIRLNAKKLYRLYKEERLTVRKRGGRLSSGQRQLVAFARAFLADPAVLILDEATSSLDIPSERLVQRALRTVLVDRTALGDA